MGTIRLMITNPEGGGAIIATTKDKGRHNRTEIHDQVQVVFTKAPPPGLPNAHLWVGVVLTGNLVSKKEMLPEFSLADYNFVIDWHEVRKHVDSRLVSFWDGKLNYLNNSKVRLEFADCFELVPSNTNKVFFQAIASMLPKAPSKYYEELLG